MDLFFTYLRNYKYFKLTRVTKKINALIYFLKKIPFIGEKIPMYLYSYYPVKQAIAVVGFLFGGASSIINKFFWLTIYITIAAFIESLNTQEPFLAVFFAFRPGVFLHGLFLWLVLTVLFFGFYGQFTLIIDKKIIDFYEEFLLSRTIVVRGTMLLDSSYQALVYIPAALVLGVLSGQIVPVVIFVPLSYLGSQYLFLLFGRLAYAWRFTNLRRKLVGTLIGVSILIFCGWVEYYGFVSFIMYALLSWWGLLFLLIFFIGSLRGLLRFKDENDFLLFWLERASLNLKRLNDFSNTENQYLNQGFAMQKKLVVATDQTFQQLSGSQYLNALLFSRYRSILNKSLVFRFYFIIAAWIAIVCASLFGVFAKTEGEELIQTLPILFFIMYLATFGKKVVQMVFVNCDVSMLYYPFYREARTIITGFNYRFKQTFYYNSVISAGIFSCYVLFQLMNDFILDWQFFGVLLLLLVALSLLFSFHELFVYYLVQPFTGDMEIVSPLYKIIAGVFYGISYANLQLGSIGYRYVILVSLISLIYVTIGFVVVYKKAPKTFRIKH
ncbi:hypothetical protein [Candidatus Enterococcus mansonii]|uniref:Uncharacterized protein n=1 Tax=Candidatus Enterococcus mansonii TaxID=1834181 RepID=A0A242C6F9_9ENTE|nr:hypothetical protein [Enterococcus sp. 4G2_DIV0659]OTO05490.1 hypothetical protein A5880_002663 [Enterococcus sp. 4G2_DIV0659]